MSVFQYVCASGHQVSSRDVVVECPAYVLGKPCRSALRRVGPGSKKAEARG